MNLATTTVSFSIVMFILILTVVVVATRRLRRSGTSMAAGEFFARMLRRARYESLGPAGLRRKLAENHNDAVIIDLRDDASYAEGHIDSAVHHQFDDFLKAVVVEGTYDVHRQEGRGIILVCDTGHMSRVAGEILVEDEGFSNVVNLRGGMHRWQRWLARQQQQRGCCGFAFLTTCCPALSGRAG